MGIVFDRPVRDIAVRSGTQANCAGVAAILADVEPAERLEFVNVQDGEGAGACDDELVRGCVAAVRRGVVQELTRQCGIPAVRFVLRRIQVRPVDAAEFRYESVGHIAVAEAVHRLTPSP